METKINSGSIFKNTKKEKDTHPDYRGVINVDGKEKQISLWVKTQKDGTTKYFSASISEPYKKDLAPQTPAPTKAMHSEVFKDDDLPF